MARQVQHSVPCRSGDGTCLEISFDSVDKEYVIKFGPSHIGVIYMDVEGLRDLFLWCAKELHR